MADQFLSQDEVDALLENVTGESQTLEEPEAEKLLVLIVKALASNAELQEPPLMMSQL